ncbi:Yip3p [Rhodotorula paludigena]|uniref:Yip3p n=1 Tax=Rhodotorula paludigena TaxID=86838 RepID=UPI003174E51E
MDTQSLAQRLPEAVTQFRERLQSLRPPNEFFDMQRVSKPADLNAATQRIKYNVNYFSGNYILLILLLAVYSLLTNPLLLIALAFLIGGYIGINKFIPEPVQFGSTTIEPRHLYMVLLIVGIPILWLSAPLSAFFWLVGSSSVLILGHAAVVEPGVESEYGQVQGV